MDHPGWMGVIPFVKDVGRQLGVGDIPPAQPGPDAQKATALVRPVGNVQGIGQMDGQRQVAQPAPEACFSTVKRGDTRSKIAAAGRGAGDDEL